MNSQCRNDTVDFHIDIKKIATGCAVAQDDVDEGEREDREEITYLELKTMKLYSQMDKF